MLLLLLLRMMAVVTMKMMKRLSLKTRVEGNPNFRMKPESAPQAKG